MPLINLLTVIEFIIDCPLLNANTALDVPVAEYFFPFAKNAHGVLTNLPIYQILPVISLYVRALLGAFLL